MNSTEFLNYGFNEATYKEMNIEFASGRSVAAQAGMQAISLGVTLAIAIIGGLATGLSIPFSG